MNQHTGKACILNINIEHVMTHLSRGPLIRAMLVVGETSEGQPVVVEVRDDGGKGASIRMVSWFSEDTADRWLEQPLGWIVIPAPVVNVAEISQT